MTPARFNRFIHIADRLAKVAAGSTATDQAIHEVARRTGRVLAYTTDEAVARTLPPPGLEWMDITPTAGWIYAPCRRAGFGADGMRYSHHGQ